MRKLILIGVLALASCVTAKVPDEDRTAPPKPADVDRVKPADQTAEPHGSTSALKTSSIDTLVQISFT